MPPPTLSRIKSAIKASSRPRPSPPPPPLEAVRPPERVILGAITHLRDCRIESR